MHKRTVVVLGTAGLALLAIFNGACGPLSPSGRTTLITAAEHLAEEAFVAGAPVLNEATASLPPEAQTLIQAGYAALTKALEAAQSAQATTPDAQAALQTVAQTAQSLHDAVHIEQPTPAN